MSDETFIEHISPIKLIARLDQSTDPNAREAGRRWAEALKRPDRTVGAALMPKQKGGDRVAEVRRRRDARIRELAAAMGPAQSIESQARAIAGRLTRFRPMPQENSPERRLMAEITSFNLPVGARSIRKILAEQKPALLCQEPGRITDEED